MQPATQAPLPFLRHQCWRSLTPAPPPAEPAACGAECRPRMLLFGVSACSRMLHGGPASLPRVGTREAMRHHLDDHCSGTLSGAVPQAYLDAHSLDACIVCGLFVKGYYNGFHARCRPASRARAHTVRHVPKAARAAWAQCLARAAAAAVTRNTPARTPHASQSGSRGTRARGHAAQNTAGSTHPTPLPAMAGR